MRNEKYFLSNYERQLDLDMEVFLNSPAWLNRRHQESKTPLPRVLNRIQIDPEAQAVEDAKKVLEEIRAMQNASPAEYIDPESMRNAFMCRPCEKPRPVSCQSQGVDQFCIEETQKYRISGWFTALIWAGITYACYLAYRFL